MINKPWLILSDFNLIYRASDNNNLNLNRRLMGRFRAALNHCELKEIHLQGRLFTWSNEQNNLTLERIDRAFCNPDWGFLFSYYHLIPLSSSISDHCPLPISGNEGCHPPRRFAFENYLPLMSGYKEVVQAAWSEFVDGTDPVKVLLTKVQRTPKGLREWSKLGIRNVKLQMHIALQIILRLDQA